MAKRFLLCLIVVASLLAVACCGGASDGGTTGGGGTPEPQPSLYITANANPPGVPPNTAFTITAMVENRGQGKAENVNIYLEPSDTGYALLQNCNHAYDALAPAGLCVHVGDMFPWDNATVTVNAVSTKKGQTQPQTVQWNVSHDYYGGTKAYDTTIQVSFSQSGGAPIGGEGE